MGDRKVKARHAETTEEHVPRRATRPVVLKRSVGAGVRVGVIALSHDGIDADTTRRIDLKRLGELATVVGSTGADVVLFCGVRVEEPPGSEPWDEVGGAVARTLGCPFLIECEDDAPNEWWLVTAEGFDAMVRSRQFVITREDVRFYSHLVLAEFGADYGRVTVRDPRGHDLRELVLLICGEARMLSLQPERLFVEEVLDWEFGLPRVFAGTNNVLLHPAHRPYAKPIPMTGWNLVGAWMASGDERRPTLGVAVTAGARVDGARPFRAAIHAGPYRRGQPRDEDVAVAAFVPADAGAGHARQPAATDRRASTADRLIEVRYAEFEV
jgi:hypothetical protein